MIGLLCAATWKCHFCGKPVPAECDGACGTGTTSGGPSNNAMVGG